MERINDNIPVGSESDMMAPWNEPLREAIKVEFSATIDATVTVDVYPDDGDEEIENEVGKTLVSALKSRFGDSLYIDNIVIIDKQ